MGRDRAGVMLKLKATATQRDCRESPVLAHWCPVLYIRFFFFNITYIKFDTSEISVIGGGKNHLQVRLLTETNYPTLRAH